MQAKAGPLLLSAVLLTGSSLAAQTRSQKPSILFLFADDMRRDTIAALGNPWIETPNLDRLARRGFAFTDNYCMGSRHGAVCAPSRAMLWSGRTLHRVRDDLRGVTTLGEVLSRAGYTTFGTGKWHNGRPSFIRSFRHGRSVMFAGMSDHRRVPVADLDESGEKLVRQRSSRKFSSELFADAAIEFLETHAKERMNRPFFAYVAFTAPHDPRDPPPGYRECYHEKKLPLPPNFLPQHPWNIDQRTLTLRDERLAGWPREPDVVRDQLAEYYGMISHLDAQIGRVLAALDRTGLAENTVVVFSADHGLAIGSHGLLGKQNLYEHSMGCPLLFKGPGIPAGESSSAMTYLLDLYPTFCEIARAEVPGSAEGKSLMPILRGEQDRVRDSLFTLYRDNQRAVRDARYKLIRFTRINKSLLFDLREDADDLHNLAGDPAHAERLARMMRLLESWQKRSGDTQPLHTDEPLPLRVDLSGRPRKPDRHQPAWIRAKYF